MNYNCNAYLSIAKGRVFLFFTLLISLSALGQTRPIDSLLQKLSETKSDSSRVHILERLSYEYLYYKPDSALVYIDEALELSKKNEYQLGLAKTYNRKGTYYIVKSQYPQAIEEFQKALPYYKQIADSTGISESLGNLGVLDFYLRDYDEALYNFQEAIKYLDTVAQFETYTKYLSNLSGVYREKKQLDSALYYARRSLSYSEKLDDKRLLSVSYFNLGTAYYFLKDYDKAISNLDEAIKLDRIPVQFSILAKSYKSLSYTILGNKNKAAAELEGLEQKALAINDQYVTLRFYEAKQKLLETEGRIAEALEYAQKYIKLNDEIHNREQINILQNIKVKYATEERIYENRLLNQEADLRNLQLQNQRYAIWAVAILVFLFLILFLILYQLYSYKSDANKKLKEKQEILNKNNRSLELINTQKDNLFSIVAHDVRSPISSILSSTQFLNSHFEEFTIEEIRHLAKGLEDQAETLNSLIQGVLVWAKSQMNGFDFHIQEVKVDELISGTLKAEETALKRKNLQIFQKIEKDRIIQTDYQVLQVIARNFLSNAIKFTPVGGSITFELLEKANFYHFRVTDTGRGMTSEEIKKVLVDQKRYSIKGTENEPGNGIGLILCQEIATKIGGRLEVESSPGEGSTFVYVFPKNYQPEKN
ncbi:MAG: hypothetical protein COA80_07045 [Leeuwenhoekiella sp.]|nr:MAG: hypothetical protein COA80_07045 [Leeuwenhoekiella sp.]